MLNVIMLSVAFYVLSCWMSLCWVSHFMYYHAECNSAECRILFIIMLNVILLSVILPSVISLNVEAPVWHHSTKKIPSKFEISWRVTIHWQSFNELVFIKLMTPWHFKLIYFEINHFFNGIFHKINGSLPLVTEGVTQKVCFNEQNCIFK
jgi:hypothetical protein